MESTGEEVVYKRVLRCDERLVVESTQSGKPILKIVKNYLTDSEKTGTMKR